VLSDLNGPLPYRRRGGLHLPAQATYSVKVCIARASAPATEPIRPARGGPTPTILRGTLMKKAIAILAALFVAGSAFAQAGTAVKEAGKATAETAKQAKENVEGAVTSEPKKTMHKVKAKVHKAKAKQHGENAKAAAKAM